MASEIESKLAGLQLALAMKNQQPQVNVAELKSTITAAISDVKSFIAAQKALPAIQVSGQVAQMTEFEDKLDGIMQEVQNLNALSSRIDFSGIVAAIDNVYQAMPEYDFSEITAAIQDAPDVRPELQAIARAISENTAALRENTEAVRQQTQAIMRDRVIGYDAEGKITKVSVR